MSGLEMFKSLQEKVWGNITFLYILLMSSWMSEHLQWKRYTRAAYCSNLDPSVWVSVNVSM